MLRSLMLQILGSAIIVFTLRDVFYDIFHPTRSGSMSDLIGRLGSKAFLNTKLRPAIGPACLVGVMIAWVVAISIGFALLYLPMFPTDMKVQTGGATGNRMIQSFYLSLGSLGTFQTFDVELQRGWLRSLVALEGLVGLGLITASVSWVVVLFPALERIRFLANKTFVLAEVLKRGEFSSLDNASQLTEMADRVLQARIDLILFPILLNFYPEDKTQTLALALPHLQKLAEMSIRPESERSLYLAGLQLQVGLERFAAMLRERVLDVSSNDISMIFDAFARREG